MRRRRQCAAPREVIPETNEGEEVTSIASLSHLPALEEPHERAAVARELEPAPRELVALSLTGKQLHWAFVGPLFRPLHRHIDNLADSWRKLADSELTPVCPPPIEDHAVVWEMTHRLAMVSERVRNRMERLGELDLASQDVLIELVRALEEQQWMLRAQLGSRVLATDGPS
jgi:starvation-inducible DNA-binding protein